MNNSQNKDRPEPRIEIRSDVVIPSAHSDGLKGDLYLPLAEQRNGAAVILVFGGSWRTGDRSQQRVYGLNLAKAGFTCLACDYRPSSQAHWPAQLFDISAAAELLSNMAPELHIDIHRIGISGNSSGGHLALMSASLHSGWKPAAVCAFYAPTRIMPPGQPGHDESFAQLMGPQASPEDFRQASPVTCIHEHFPPVLLIVGDADSRVTAEDTHVLYRELRTAGLAAELHSFTGLEHAFDMQRELAVICSALMVSFFKRNLVDESGASGGVA